MLTEPQQKLLSMVCLHLEELMALRRQPLASMIGINNKQRAEIKVLADKFYERAAPIQRADWSQKNGDTRASDSRRRQLQKLSKELDIAIAETLTSKQRLVLDVQIGDSLRGSLGACLRNH